jgi:hypothetical protein
MALEFLPEHLVVREDCIEVADHLPVPLPQKPRLVLLELQVALKCLAAAQRVVQRGLYCVQLVAGGATVLDALVQAQLQVLDVRVGTVQRLLEQADNLLIMAEELFVALGCDRDHLPRSASALVSGLGLGMDSRLCRCPLHQQRPS